MCVGALSSLRYVLFEGQWSILKDALEVVGLTDKYVAMEYVEHFWQQHAAVSWVVSGKYKGLALCPTIGSRRELKLIPLIDACSIFHRSDFVAVFIWLHICKKKKESIIFL